MDEIFPLPRKLPAIAYAIAPSTGETIAIRRGELGYLRVSTCLSAEELNILYGVSKPQAKAMFAGVMLGWHTPAADPDNYDAEGRLVQSKCA
jgi:hypothetical protein